MDPLANKGWTSSEVEQAMAIISKHNSHRIMYADNDDNNGKHNNIMDDLLELFPSKTRQQVIDLYLGLAMEMYMMQPREERHVDGGITHSIGTVNLGNSNFGVPEESGSGSICGTYALGDLVNDDFVVQEEETPTIDNNGFPFGCVLEDTMIIQTKETLPVVDKNKMEVLENNVSSYQPVVAPHQGRYWTTEEHKLFLHGLRVYGRGNWKSISKHFVTTRTHIQVSSHAQKYFKRLQKRATSGTQRYSINDVQLHDDHTSAVDNSFAPSQALAFTRLNNGTNFGLQDPASSSIVMNNLPQLWSPFIYDQQVGQQQMWSEQQVMDPTAVVMDGIGNSTPSYEQGSTYFSLGNV